MSPSSVGTAILLAAALACPAIAAEPSAAAPAATAAAPRVTLSLTDGSRLIGEPSVARLDVHTEHGDVHLKWSDIRTIDWKAGDSAARFNLVNGDMLSGRPAIEKVDLKTVFGTVTVPLVSARRLMSLGEAGEELLLDLGGGVTMRLVLIRPGKFMMGSPDKEPGPYMGEGPMHEVTISAPFFMGVTEVTQAQYEAVMGTNPSVCEGASNPVDTVSWNDAAAFVKKLAAKIGRPARLPTEAEWEYACRAGTTTRYSFGDDAGQLGDYAWYKANGGDTSHPVGQKKPNAWGLYDMHGNVWEWCSDWQGEYPKDPQSDPTGPASGPARLYRGGSHGDVPEHCRSNIRKSQPADYQHDSLGLRVVVGVLTAGPATPAAGVAAARAAAPKPAEPSEVRIALDLLDGSHIRGVAAADGLDVATAYGTARIRWQDVRTCYWNIGELATATGRSVTGRTGRFNMLNGDTVSGPAVQEKLDLKTLVGPVTIPLSHIRQLWVLGAAAATRPFALSFDGKQNFVEVPNDPALDPTKAMTLECWFKSNVANTFSMLGKRRFEEGNDHGYQIHITFGNLHGYWEGHYLPGRGVLNDGKWHHAALTWDGNRRRLYEDGVKVAEDAPGPWTPYNGTLRIGAIEGNHVPDFYNGAISQVRLSKVDRYGGRNFTP